MKKCLYLCLSALVLTMAGLSSCSDDTLADNMMGPVDTSVYARIRCRWILSGYTDADGTHHQVGNGWGDDRYSIQFKEFDKVEGYKVEGCFNSNEYRGTYSLSNIGKREGYGGYIDNGNIRLTCWSVTEVHDDNDPVSDHFPRVFNATKFELYSYDYLYLYITSKEYFAFRYEFLQ